MLRFGGSFRVLIDNGGQVKTKGRVQEKQTAQYQILKDVQRGAFIEAVKAEIRREHTPKA